MTSNFLLRFALLLLLSASLAACTSDQRIGWKFYQANRMLRKGNATRASELYYEAYEVDPEGPRAAEALFEYAHTLEVHERDPLLAVEVYRRLARLFSTDPHAIEALERAGAIELTQTNRPERALLDYQRLLELYPQAPGRAGWLVEAAECYTRMGHAAQAETELRNFLATTGAVPEALRIRASNMLGKVLLVQERPGEAARIFEDLSTRLSKDPTLREEWIEARFNLGQALSELDETDWALRVFREIEGEFPRQEVIQEKINFLTIRQEKRRR